MKGTLFSADFVKDSNGNLRLLELNTDTAFTSGALHQTDFTEFINVISSSNINEVHVIYKDALHSNFVQELSHSLSQTTFITTFNKSEEESNSIYPTLVEDSESKFILRLAYDESAIFDSMYCKKNENTYAIFHDNNDSGSVAEIYMTSSELNFDTLRHEVNDANVPDVVVKPIQSVTSSLSFYKVDGDGTTTENFQNFVSNHPESIILNYYNNPSETTHKSHRSFNIIYGTNLDIINLANLDVESVFSKPESLSVGVDGKVNKKHFYEFASNYPSITSKNGFGGIFEEELITDVNGNGQLVSSITVGESYKSYFVSGSPDTDSPILFGQWSHDGSSLPSGSYETSSILINKVGTELQQNVISHVITQDSASFRMTGNQHLMIYDTSEDKLKFEMVGNIDADIHHLLKDDGTTVGISSNDIEILDGDYTAYLLDFEEVDTYILHESGINVKVIAHNACFPAGTEITLEDGNVKNIEDIQEGDTLISFDTHNKKFTTGRVSKVHKSVQQDLVEITTETGEVVKSTLGHRIYSSEGWRDAKDLREGDVLINSNGDETKITNIEKILGEFEVYHIMNVGNDHTYFANGILVHNFSISFQPGLPSCFVAGTTITMRDGELKNIEDVVVGDDVLSYNEEHDFNESGIVGDLKSHEVESVIRLTLDNETVIITTEEHPFFVKGKGWVKAGELKPLDECKKSDGSDALVSTVEVLNEKHTVYNLLNVSSHHNFYANGILVHNK